MTAALAYHRADAAPAWASAQVPAAEEPFFAAAAEVVRHLPRATQTRWATVTVKRYQSGQLRAIAPTWAMSHDQNAAQDIASRIVVSGPICELRVLLCERYRDGEVEMLRFSQRPNLDVFLYTAPLDHLLEPVTVTAVTSKVLTPRSGDA